MKKQLLLIPVLFPIYTFSQLWQNDFSNPAAWISTDLNAGTDAWVISSAAIGGDVDSISSVSAATGFAQFDSESQCNATHQDVVLMYYQPIDISASEHSYLEFVQHYKRKSDSVYVEFSNDGLTWQSIRINKQYWYYQQTHDPDTVQISIPESVQSQPFYLRFRYSGECGFAWLIDDVKIFEKEEHALITRVSMVINDNDYYAVNHCLVDTLDLRLNLVNDGFDTLFSIVILSELFEDGVSVQLLNDTLDFISPNADTTLVYTDFHPIYAFSGDALYATVVKSFSAELDTVTTTDSLHFLFEETLSSTPEVEGVFQTNNTIRGLGYSFIAPDNGEGFCSSRNYLYVPEQTTGGQFIYLVWYKRVNGNWQYSSQTDDVIIPTTGSSGIWIDLDYNGTDYVSGDTGLVMIVTYGDEVPVSYGEQSSNESVYLLNEFYEPYLDLEGHAPLIKMTVGYLGTCSCLGGWNEFSAIELSIYPNPVIADHVVMEIPQQHFDNLTHPEILITDVSGKIVQHDILVNAKYSWQTERIQNGVYLVMIKSDNTLIETQKLVINH